MKGNWEKKLYELINFRGDISPDNAVNFIRQLLASELARQREKLAKEIEGMRIKYPRNFPSKIITHLNPSNATFEVRTYCNGEWYLYRWEVLTQAAKKVREGI